MNDYLQFLDKRASVREFDNKDILSDEIVMAMLEHASYAPSSNNFQPWRVVAVKNKEKQAELMKLSYGQKQVEMASVVFLLFGDRQAYDLDWWQTFHVKKGIIAKDEVSARAERIRQYFALHPEDKTGEGLRLDVGLFAMNLMQVVRAFGYDSVPMRGVDFAAIKTYLNISDTWEPILMLPVGKAVKVGYPHVRKPVEDFAKIIK